MAPTNALKPSGAWKNQQPSVPSGDANAGSIAHLKDGIGKIDFSHLKDAVRVACCLKSPMVNCDMSGNILERAILLLVAELARWCQLAQLDWLNSILVHEMAILDGKNHTVR